MSATWLAGGLLAVAGLLAWLRLRTKAPPTPFEIWQARERTRR